MTDAEKIAEFLAKRGATRVATGESALGYSARDWRNAARGNAPRRAKEGYTQSVTIDHRGHEWRTNEHGEIIFIG